MRSSFVPVALALLTAIPVATALTTRAVSSALYEELVLYTKYSSAAYQLTCPRPLGNTLIKDFEFGRTQTLIVRDNTRKEIVVAFRGTFSLTDAVTDAKILLKPLICPGLDALELVNTTVHHGFLDAYNDVAEEIIGIVDGELKKLKEEEEEGFRIVVTGHSLGGAIASIAAPSLKAALPDAELKLFTFGQPRVGNANFARMVENLIGVKNIFRAVHTWDGVPTMVPRLLGYEHFATEYWQFEEPILKQPRDTIKRCVGGEDPTCSASIPSTGINPPHTRYFGQLMAMNPMLCF
ncbi:Lipase-3 domain-containing protein [Mycena chlorophos]|uniref:Lipase-3 domain-containing protein n=1 Tax=Mycena chlorophos TaxID=658473 RepID=A0A8H6SJ45_MYCCL|nr:Lipase-3 domain-containing protein [Mycena chlorophos]